MLIDCLHIYVIKDETEANGGGLRVFKEVLRDIDGGEQKVA